MTMKDNRISERGVTLYLTIIILTIILVMTLGIGVIFVNQLKLVGDVGASMIAFHAGEAGIERVLRIDACLLITDKNSRVACVQEVSGIVESDMPADCKVLGALNNTQERGCRRDLVNGPMKANEPHIVDNASYTLQIVDPSATCEGNPDWGYCGTSTGTFRNTQRRAEVVR